MYWRTHAASPGEPTEPGERIALCLYQESEQLGGQDGWQVGFERAMQLRTLRLSPAEAEALQVRLLWLAENLPGMSRAFWKDQTKK